MDEHSLTDASQQGKALCSTSLARGVDQCVGQKSRIVEKIVTCGQPTCFDHSQDLGQMIVCQQPASSRDATREDHVDRHRFTVHQFRQCAHLDGGTE